MPNPSERMPRAPEIEKRATEQMTTREGAIQRAAVAAGTTRSENDADALGYAPKRPTREAGRVLLG